MELLLIDDGKTVAENEHKALQSSGISIKRAHNRAAALHSSSLSEYDILLLDLNIPWLCALDLIAHLRKEGSRIPIMVLGTCTELLDRVTALDEGADDHLCKPFELDELIARIRALHRRHSGWEPEPLRHGELELDPFSRMVTIRGDEIPLSAKEFDILHILLEHRGRVISRQTLSEKIYNLDDDVMSNALDVHIHNLRKKLGDHPIQTVRGAGYLIKR